MRRVKNGLLDVSQHAHWLRLRLLLSGNHAWQDTLDGLAAATAGDVAAQRARILDGCHLEALVEGNLSAERAAEMCRCGCPVRCSCIMRTFCCDFRSNRMCNSRSHTS